VSRAGLEPGRRTTRLLSAFEPQSLGLTCRFLGGRPSTEVDSIPAEITNSGFVRRGSPARPIVSTKEENRTSPYQLGAVKFVSFFIGEVNDCCSD
jgi:hypothetical protein